MYNTLIKDIIKRKKLVLDFANINTVFTDIIIYFT